MGLKLPVAPTGFNPKRQSTAAFSSGLIGWHFQSHPEKDSVLTRFLQMAKLGTTIYDKLCIPVGCIHGCSCKKKSWIERPFEK